MKATNVPTAAGVINFNRFLRFSTKNNCIKNNFDELVMVTPIQLKSNIYPEENKNQQIGTPLLIIHGLFGHKQNWKSTAKAIQKHLSNTVHVIDLRNHGDSPHDPCNSYSAMVADLVKYIEDVISPTNNCVDLLGHSMGGKVVADLALHNEKSKYIRKLIIEDVSLHRGINGGSRGPYAKYIQAMKQANLCLSRREIDSELATSITNMDVRQFLLTNLAELEINNKEGVKQRWRWRCNLDALEKSLDEILRYAPIDINSSKRPFFDKQTLFIAGENSNHLNFPNDEAILNESFHHSQFITIQNAEHWVHFNQPHAFIDVVCRFLQDDY